VANCESDASSMKYCRQLRKRCTYALPVSVDARSALASREMAVQKIEDKPFADI
jgi:hypothetical protein